eukprot:jgi/Botrbrau1/23448/Bobra.106_1s0008.1
MSNQGKKPSKKLARFVLSGHEYKVNDTVYIKGQGEELPFLGKIRDITELLGTSKPPRDRIICKVTWYYRPEEAEGGRKRFHGAKELFKSDHEDKVFASSIEGECKVHTLATYQALDSPGDDDYFARFTYLVVKKEFKPDRVPVYCVCELPYNPDLFMICCTECEEWFHPECLGMTDEEGAAKSRTFNCAMHAPLRPSQSEAADAEVQEQHSSLSASPAGKRVKTAEDKSDRSSAMPPSA